MAGDEDPVFDAGTDYRPFQGLMALDLATGAVKWNVEYSTEDKALKKAYSAPVIDGDTIFAAGKGTVYAIDKASGAVRWKSDKVLSGIFSSGVISQVLPTPDAVYIRLGGNFFNAPEKTYELKKPLGVMALDRATGAKRWEYKNAREGITNLALLPDRGVVLLSDAYNLTGLDLAADGKGSARFEVPIEFKRKMSGGEVAAAGVGAMSGFLTGGLAGAIKGGAGAAGGKARLDVPVALIPRADGKVVVAGKQHLMLFDPAVQKIVWSTYYPAPGSSAAGLAVMSALTVVAATSYAGSVAAGGMSSWTADSYGQNQYGALNSYASRRYEASKQARDYAYVLTSVTEGKDSGVGLLAISLTTGEPGAQVVGVAASREEDHRHVVARGAEAATHLEAVDIGQVDVEHDEVGRTLREHRECRTAVGNGAHVVAVEAQPGGEQLADRVVVLDDDESRQGPGRSMRHGY